MSEEIIVMVDEELRTMADNTVKINVEDGDALLVTLPESIDDLPNHQKQKYADAVGHQFKEAVDGKDVKVIVVPHGMKVEIIKSSFLQDK